MRNINLFFPIEIIKRELDYKIILACMLLENHQSAVIAQHDRIEKFILKTNNGLYIGKNIMNKPNKLGNKYAMYESAKKKQFSIIHIDEEGGIYAGEDQRIKEVLDERLDINILKSDDLVCTWGNFQSEHYKNKLLTNNGPSIVNTGYIKFDITKHLYYGIYEPKILEYQKEYGDYILINSHFSFANNAYGISDTFSIRNGYGPSEKEKERLTDLWADEQIKITYFVKLAQVLSIKFPSINFIFRPHPAEDFAYYKNIFKDINNVIVNNDGEVIPWLLGAKCMIHDRCTTSVEAHLMNIPVINYLVNENQDHKSPITKKIGTKCTSEEEVIKCITEIINGVNGLEKTNSFNDPEFNLLTNLKKNSSDFIISLIKDVLKEKKKNNTKTLSIFRILFMEYLYGVFLAAKYPIRKLFFKEKQKYFEADTGAFPGFNKSEIESKLATLSKSFNSNFKLNFLSERVFIIKKR